MSSSLCLALYFFRLIFSKDSLSDSIQIDIPLVLYILFLTEHIEVHSERTLQNSRKSQELEALSTFKNGNKVWAE